MRALVVDGVLELIHGPRISPIGTGLLEDAPSFVDQICLSPRADFSAPFRKRMSTLLAIEAVHCLEVVVSTVFRP